MSLTIPPRKWTAIGLPYRGLRLGNTLTLEDGHVLDLTGVTELPSSGDTWLYKAPSPPGISRTPAQAAEDLQRHWVWKDYEIWLRFSDADKEWVYVDPAGTCWWMRYEFLKSGNNFTINVRCLGRYGVYKIDIPADPATSYVCGSGSFSGTRSLVPSQAEQDFLSFATDANLSPLGRVMPTPDGAKAIINIGHIGPPATSTGAMFQTTATDIINIELSGTGSLEAATWAQGITATVARIKDGSDLFPVYTGWQYSTNIISTGTCCCGTPASPTSPPGGNTATGPAETESIAEFEWDFYQFHWYDTSGNLRWLRDQQTFVETTTDTYSYSLAAEWVECPECPSGWLWQMTSSTFSESRTKSETASRTITIGEETLTFGWTASHTGDITGAGDAALGSDCSVELPDSDASKINAFNVSYNAIAGAAATDQRGAPPRPFNASASIFMQIQTNENFNLVGYSGGKITVNDPSRTIKATYHPVTKDFEYTINGQQPQWI